MSAGQDDAFVATFDAQGRHLGSRSFGSPGGMEWGRAAGLDAAGSAYVAGLFSGPTDLGAGPVTTDLGPSLFVASFPR